jgi:hypothetical protein
LSEENEYERRSVENRTRLTKKGVQVSKKTLREQYEEAIQFGKLAFIERPYFGGPAAPAQEKTNVSATWSHMNAGFLIGYEHALVEGIERSKHSDHLRLELAK